MNDFDSQSLLQLAPTCRHFHTIILRLIHSRLQSAAELEGQTTTLYLTCQRPSEQWTAKKIYCHILGTEGLEELQSAIQDEHNVAGQVKSIFGLYSRFRPLLKEPLLRTRRYQSAAEVDESSTYLDVEEDNTVSKTVTVDAHDLFSQLDTKAFLCRREPTNGVLTSMHHMNKGQIRVWRKFLLDQCETKCWTDGEPIIVHHDAPSSPKIDGEASSDSVIGTVEPSKDPSVLWLNTGDNSLGLRVGVRERIWRGNNPTPGSSDTEVAVSYQVDFEGESWSYYI